MSRFGLIQRVLNQSPQQLDRSEWVPDRSRKFLEMFLKNSVGLDQSRQWWIDPLSMDPSGMGWIHPDAFFPCLTYSHQNGYNFLQKTLFFKPFLGLKTRLKEIFNKVQLIPQFTLDWCLQVQEVTPNTLACQYGHLVVK